MKRSEIKRLTKRRSAPVDGCPDAKREGKHPLAKQRPPLPRTELPAVSWMNYLTEQEVIGIYTFLELWKNEGKRRAELQSSGAFRGNKAL